ncbi:hypothetical protein Tco_0005588 [Tanacetum coccineum]
MSKAKNASNINVAWLGPKSVEKIWRMVIKLLDQVRTSIKRDVRTFAIEKANTPKYSSILERHTISKTTTWNEFSSTMSSAIICLATNQKFNFSKYIFEKLGEGSAILTDPHHTPTIIQPSTQPQKTQKPRKPKRKDTQVPQPSDPSENVVDEAVHKELGDSLVRAATTASSLEAKQDM